MKKIPLTQGKFALVDDEDFEWLNQWKWYFKFAYAARGVRVNGKVKILRMHREITNPPDGYDTDHIDGNGINNQRGNLRICTHAENMRNQRVRRTSKSGYRGVHFDKSTGKWISQICLNSKNIHLGCFEDSKEAAIIYNQKALELHGEFAKLNEIGE